MNMNIEANVDISELMDSNQNWGGNTCFQQSSQNYVQSYVPPPPYPSTGVISPYQDQALSPPPMPSPSPGFYSTTSPFTQDQCTSPCPSVWSEAENNIPELPAELPDLSHVNLTELSEAEAIMAAEATGSRMPIIKNELKYKIQKKRRESGLEELQVQYKKPEPEVLTAKDKERRERRRASNRRAAAKCRIKKKDAANQQELEKKQLETANEELRRTIRQLEEEKEHFIKELKLHRLAGCLR